MKIEIKNRWSGSIMFETEIEATEDTPISVRLGFAIMKAVEAKADLKGAYLSEADMRAAVLRGVFLDYADLRRADLREADMRAAILLGADLRAADLRGADLCGADLNYANLSGADLNEANLSRAGLIDAALKGADLVDANLRDADLHSADLRYADLWGADLSGAVLSDVGLRSFKADLWMTLTQNPREAIAVVRALKAGKVDWDANGECAGLVGTIANARGCSYDELEHNPHRPAEQWFQMISKGDKPGDDTGGGFAAQKALEWCEEWCRLTGVEVPAEAPDLNPETQSAAEPGVRWGGLDV